GKEKEDPFSKSCGFIFEEKMDMKEDKEEEHLFTKDAEDARAQMATVEEKETMLNTLAHKNAKHKIAEDEWDKLQKINEVWEEILYLVDGDILEFLAHKAANKVEVIREAIRLKDLKLFINIVNGALDDIKKIFVSFPTP
ncbi:hypothetical protein ACJX0J_012348, partial [Zea mays]